MIGQEWIVRIGISYRSKGILLDVCFIGLNQCLCGDLNFFIICLVLIITVLLLVRPYCLCYVVVCLVMI